MKILFVNNSLRGLVYFRLDVMRHLQSQGHEVVAVVPSSEKGRANIDGVRVLYVPLRRTSVNPLSDVILLFSLVRVFRREKPDYAFLFTIKPNIYGTLAAWLCRIHSSMMMAGMGQTFTNNRLSSNIARSLYRLTLKISDHLLLLNKQDVETVKRLGLCKTDKIVYMDFGEGVSLQQYQYRDNRSNKVRFLFVGRLLKEKGVLDFIEAARIVKRQLPEMGFQIAGEVDAASSSSLTREDVEKISTSGVVEFIGHVDMVEKLKEPGTVIVVPSYYSEGLNRSLMEGCAAGKPIITTSSPGCVETVIDGRNGYVVDAKNPEMLAEAMLRYVNLTDEAKQSMSLESRTLAENRFDVRDVFAIYDRILEKCDGSWIR